MASRSTMHRRRDPGQVDLLGGAPLRGCAGAMKRSHSSSASAT